MFDLFESLFGTTQSSPTSKEAPETVTRDATTSVTSNSQPRRGRQQLRDRSTVVDGTCHTTKHTTTGLGVSQSCPPPIHRNSPSNAKDSVNSSNHRQTRTTVNGKGPDGKKHNPINATRVTTTTSNNHPSHRMDDAHYRDHSCPPSLTSTTTRQQAHTTTKTSQRQERENCNSNDSHRKNHNPSVLSNNKNCHTKKTKDLVSVMRNEPSRLAFLRMIGGKQHRRVGSHKL